MMVSDQYRVCAGDSPSLTLPEMVTVPWSTGVPLIESWFPAGAAVSPAGRPLTGPQL